MNAGFRLPKEITERNEDLNNTPLGVNTSNEPAVGPVAQIRIKTRKRAFHHDPDPTQQGPEAELSLDPCRGQVQTVQHLPSSAGSDTSG